MPNPWYFNENLRKKNNIAKLLRLMCYQPPFSEGSLETRRSETVSPSS